ncbi:MAG: tRNA pseudouridine(38-40) synthase TruA [Pseudomonadota bacterium]
MRLAAAIEYNGAGFAGWQRQGHAPSVQAALEGALSRVADTAVEVVASGRTDAGVHALAQVVHFDTTVARPSHGWRMGANTHLPDSVCVHWIDRVPDDFHARYDTLDRCYRYVILNRDTRPAVGAGAVTWFRKPLDVARMEAGAQALIGEHDFSAFRAAGCQAKHARRSLDRLTVARQGEYVVVEVVGNAFLHNMVRIIVGCLLDVGTGAQAEGYPGELLASRDRTRGSVTAVPDGLYFVGPRYADEIGVPSWRKRSPFLLAV